MGVLARVYRYDAGQGVEDQEARARDWIVVKRIDRPAGIDRGSVPGRRATFTKTKQQR